MSTYPAPDLYTPMIFNQASYKTSSETPLSSYLRKAGGENVTATETFLGGIKTDTVKDVAGNSLLTTTGLGANVVSSSLTSVGNLSSLAVTGNVTVDTNVLYVDTTNNRVGVNKSNPAYDLDVNGTLKASFIQLPQDFNYSIQLRGNTVYGLICNKSITVDSGSSFKINYLDVLTATSLGSGVVSSSLTSVGALTGLTAGTQSVQGSVKMYGETYCSYGAFSDPLVGTTCGLKCSGNLAADISYASLEFRGPKLYNPNGNLQLEGSLSNTLRSDTLYASTSAHAADVTISGSSGFLQRSTSSVKYKTEVEDVKSEYSAKIFDLRPVWYRSTCELDRKDWSHWGLIAEEVDLVDKRLVSYDSNTGEPVGVQYVKLIPLLIHQLKILKEEVEKLKYHNW